MAKIVNAAMIEHAAQVLREGGLVSFPTETVYGLGADATCDQAVAKVFAAKGRPSFNPLIVHAAESAAALELGEFGPGALKLAAAFWPGPLTLVVPRARRCPISLLASAGLPCIALRVPDHPVARDLLAGFGRPAVAPSANASGRLSPTTAAHVAEGLASKLDLILDGGPCRLGLESTIIGFADGQARLLRPGAVPRAAIERLLDAALAEAGSGTRPAAPGQLDSHYAPRAKLRLEARSRRDGEAYLGFGHHAADGRTLSAKGDLVEAAANLFRLLHELDAGGAEVIAVAPIPSTGLGEAINDRLKRAAAPRIGIA